eukprot:m.153316 g.153316  ORF g.153316 m.153316 type:complete len:340 (-) comp23442_c0_seq2:15-1034(-)
MDSSGSGTGTRMSRWRVNDDHRYHVVPGLSDGGHGRGWGERMNRVVDITLPWLAGGAALFFTSLIVAFLLPGNSTAHISIAPRLLSLSECDLIVTAAEATATQRGGWETERHAHYPTTDFAITSIPAVSRLWNTTLGPKVMGALQATVGLGLGPLHTEDVFVVKYSATQPQRGLRLHRDHSHVSFNIALNDLQEYEGGGTHIVSLGPLETTIRIGKGDVLMHMSGLVHEGVNVTAGTRYILVGFVMGQFPWWYLWSHSWGFTANCIAFNTEDPLCFSRFTALHRMWLHIYTTLCDNTPTMWGAPILVILLIFCFVVLAAGCVANSIFDPELELEKPKFY